MSQAFQYFSRHDLDGTCLQVMADDADGVAQVIAAEQTVAAAYRRTGRWRHRWVNLFILEDLSPLAREVAGARAGGAAGGGLESRPMVHVYNVTQSEESSLFVNRRAMRAEGHWGDDGALRGLLAHEHAHPLSETPTTRSARALQVVLAPAGRGEDRRVHAGIERVLDLLCRHGAQEVLATALACEVGFGPELEQLDLRAIGAARAALAGRVRLVAALDQQVENGGISAAASQVLLLAGDLEAHLPLALDIAGMRRSGAEAAAARLTSRLGEATAALHPAASSILEAAITRFRGLAPDLGGDAFATWCEGAVAPLVEAAVAAGVPLRPLLRAGDAGALPNSTWVS